MACGVDDRGRLRELAWVFLRLGTTAFGGPAAHVGYFRRAFVEERQWLDESAYARLLAFCQFLPGPASSQLGFAIGCRRGGVAGGILFRRNLWGVLGVGAVFFYLTRALVG